MNFIKSVLSSLLAIWITIVVFVVVAVGVVVSLSNDMVKEVKPNSVLEIDLHGEINDYSPFGIDPVTEMLGITEQTIGFNNLCKAIEKATYDDDIKGISLKNIPENMGLAQLTALRKMLQTFKGKDKFIYAFNDTYSQKQYYLSSVADMVAISPLGYVELKGLHSEVMFYKDFQEKYGVKMEVIRHGKYKSAVEPFIANEMSDANREQISELIKSVWSEVSKEIAVSRNINVDEAVNKMYGQSSQMSLEHGLVDNYMYADEYDNYIKGRLDTEELEKVSILDYMSNLSLLNLVEEKNKIAVIYAQGEIQYGQGDINIIGQKKMIEALEDAAKDKEVKAIVFRVNSPGGSAMASDLIWNAVEKAKTEKPVIVSMGNYAASGGYYIACGADRIFAEPTTITGSIGVFGMLPNAAELAKEIGVNSEVVSTHNNGAYYSVVKPVDDRYKKVIKGGIENIYDEFLQRVSQGRNMTVEEVDAIAQGRVWTGVKALEIGLVDEIGGLDAAISYAANLVDAKDYSLKEMPTYDMDFKEMFNLNPFAKSNINGLLSQYNLQWLANTKELMEAKGIQARIPFQMNIE
ncbi:signal peptide peptidase SppA [Wenyingzhuangia sp. chi5]|uniref:Signal peptide peptidase SppA n=1 Tax=Wenyingzhuangia gilva TaxID=3057677 RepID=A0ABT8VQK3_9FLAO|nr:signal peptide peptidase SppA [Wenyingzhuangia sp. chi5]MDO3694238.1 signal peptide peptidase SppA [Wenyingzhuangia sp. chi5]